MKTFWPWFFAFLFILVLTAGAVAGADAIQSAIDYTGYIAKLIAWGVVGFAFAALGVAVLFGVAFVVTYWRRQELALRRPRDGAFALQKVRLNNGEMMYFDPNQMASAAAVVNRRAGTVTDVEPGMGWHMWQPVRVAIQQTRLVQAMYPGDDVRDERSKAPSVSAAALRAMTQNKTPRIEVIDGEAQPVPQMQAPQPVGLIEAMRNNTPRTFALGATETGHVVRWQSQSNPHLRVHGLTQGSGKTNLLKIIAAGALNKGAHVVVLDRRRGKDWTAFDGRIELIDTSNPQNFARAVLNAYSEFEQRDRALAAAGAPNIDTLGDYKRLILIVSEFGVTWTDADAEGLRGDIQKPLIDMMRMSGASGVHWCFEDQIPDKGVWPRAITANTVPVAGKSDNLYGSLVGYHKAHELPPYHFHFGGQVFKTWDMTTPDARRFVAGSPHLNGYRLAVSSGGQGGGTREETQETLSGRTVEETLPESNKWDDFIIEYMANHPGLWNEPPVGIRELARAMSRHDTGTEDSESSYVGIASKTCKKIRHSARLAGGDKIGVDVSTVAGQR